MWISYVENGKVFSNMSSIKDDINSWLQNSINTDTEIGLV